MADVVDSPTYPKPLQARARVNSAMDWVNTGFYRGILSLGELTGCDFSAWPNVQRWYDRIQALLNWQSVNAALYAWANFTKGPDYVRV